MVISRGAARRLRRVIVLDGGYFGRGLVDGDERPSCVMRLLIENGDGFLDSSYTLRRVLCMPRYNM